MRVAIFHTAFLGDIALLGLLIEGLARSGHEVTLVSHALGTALYQKDGRIYRTIALSKGKRLKKLSRLFANAKILKELAPDVLLVPHRSLTSALTTRASAIRRTVGYKSSTGARIGYSELRTRDLNRHESLRCLDLAPDWLIAPALRKQLEDEEGRTILRPQGDTPRLPVETPNGFFIVSPGSAWETKIFPPEKLAQVINHLIKITGKHCVITGSHADQAAVAELEKGFAATNGPRSRLINTCAQLPLADLPGLMQAASFVIANDSAPVHVACGVGTPTLAIFGPTDPAWGYGPSGPKTRVLYYKHLFSQPLKCQPCSIHGTRQCPQGHHRCMRDITPDQVVDAVVDLLPQKKPRPEPE